MCRLSCVECTRQLIMAKRFSRIIGTVGPSQLYWALAAARLRPEQHIGCFHYTDDSPIVVEATRVICQAFEIAWLGDLGCPWRLWRRHYGESRVQRIFNQILRKQGWAECIEAALGQEMGSADVSLVLGPTPEHRLLEPLAYGKKIDFVVDGWMWRFQESMRRTTYLARRQGIPGYPSGMTEGAWAPPGVGECMRDDLDIKQIPKWACDIVAEKAMMKLDCREVPLDATWVIASSDPQWLGSETDLMIRWALQWTNPVVVKPHPRQEMRDLERWLASHNNADRITVLSPPASAYPVEMLAYRFAPSRAIGPVSTALPLLKTLHNCETYVLHSTIDAHLVDVCTRLGITPVHLDVNNL